jgi:hypothetical protein
MGATFNKEVKTGNFKVADDYSTVGPSSVFHIRLKKALLKYRISKRGTRLF